MRRCVHQTLSRFIKLIAIFYFFLSYERTIKFTNKIFKLKIYLHLKMSDSYDESLSNVRIITKYFLLRRNKHLSCKSQLLIIMKNNLRNFSRIVLFTIMSRKKNKTKEKYTLNAACLSCESYQLCVNSLQF